MLGIKHTFSTSKARKIVTSPLFVALSIYLFIQLQIFNLSINMADEGFFLDSAIKINLGKIPYRDFFMQVTPGNYYVLAFFLKLFGNYIIIDRVLFIAYTCLLLAVLSRLFKLKGIWSYSYLILIVFLQIGPSTFISYNSAYGIAILAFYFLKRGIESNKLKYIVFSGLLSGVCFIFKQNIGGIVILTYPIMFFMFSQKQNLVKVIIAYLLSSVSVVFLMFLYFFANSALSQMLYYVFFFAAEMKSTQIPFFLHRLFFIPIFLVISVVFLRLKRQKRIIFALLIISAFSLYLISNPQRIGRLSDYLLNYSFYLQTLIFFVPLIIFSKYIIKVKKTEKDRNLFMYSVVLLDLFFADTLQGYGYGTLVLVSVFLIPTIFLFFDKVRPFFSLAILLFFIIIFSPFFYNPFSSYFLYIGKYKVNSFTNYLLMPSAKYIKFNREEKQELVSVISYIQNNTNKGQKLLCFPYCPMMYVLADRQGTTYYGIFGLSKDEETVVKQLEKEPPELVVLIKQGNYIITPSLNINNFSIIYSYVKKNYKLSLVTHNFDAYKLK